MNGSLRAVVSGAGMIGAVHAAAIRASGGELAGVVASTPERSARVAEEWNVPGRYPDFAAVLADDSVSVVHVCTPNALHIGQAEAALRAGKHVICEKPLATSAADAQRLTSLAQETGLVLAVPFVYRYHPLVRELRDRRLRGEFGAWQLLHGSYLQDWMLSEEAMSWRVDPADGGPSRAFADIGSHWCDLVEWVAGVRFTELTARLGTTVPTRPAGTGASFATRGGGPRVRVRTEDVATVLLRTDGGALATLTVSQVSAGRKNRLWFELDGARGSAVFDQENPETVWLGAPDGARVLFRDPAQGSAEQRRLSRLPAGHAQGYAECFTSFVSDAYAAIRGDAPEGLPTGADGVRSARIVEAVLTSSASLTWTDVDPTEIALEATA
ncbi:Gfo/Idh/MocA family protein [Streptomyces violaceusniger]|uniref:Oxidoreductase domain protein n=1 Tax=Streptomyces violaceusniger (strain Tu 4113) TaxID=653045 RepID=G2NTY7_STRV4|nr:Gfo/Idh/MocA family oxidoreductase [Streptomyces violaceusniger]AEM83876.1 oxidoreductase domain protein [Streptomyces violaceusniger Tu 4113]